MIKKEKALISHWIIWIIGAAIVGVIIAWALVNFARESQYIVEIPEIIERLEGREAIVADLEYMEWRFSADNLLEEISLRKWGFCARI